MAIEVFANIGAEEGPRWRQTCEHPAVRMLADAFKALFSPPSFSWLEADEGLYPWLATQEAEQEAERRAIPLLGPDVASVAHVHDKAFVHTASLATDSASAVMRVFEPHELDDEQAFREQVCAHISSHSDWYRCGLIIKPRWGTSGRGRLSWSSSRNIPLEAAVGRRGLQKMKRRHGAVLEPWLTRRQDYSVQLFVPAQGTPEVLATTVQALRPAGVYLGNSGVIDEQGRPSAGEMESKLLPGAYAAAQAAQTAGFTGPCGIDAFTFVGPDGGEHLRPIVEVNARATGGTMVAARVKAAVLAKLAKPGDTFRYDAATDALTFSST